MTVIRCTNLNDIQNFLFLRHNITIYQDPSVNGFVLKKVLSNGDISRHVENNLSSKDLVSGDSLSVLKRSVLRLLGECETIKISTKFFTGVELK